MIRENNLVAHSAVWKGLVAGMTLLDRKVLVLRSFSQFPTLLSTFKEVLWCLSRLTTQERNCVDEHHNTSLVSKSIQWMLKDWRLTLFTCRLLPFGLVWLYVCMYERRLFCFVLFTTTGYDPKTPSIKFQLERKIVTTNSIGIGIDCGSNDALHPFY